MIKNVIISMLGTLIIMERLFEECTPGVTVLIFFVYAGCIFIFCESVDERLRKLRNRRSKTEEMRRQIRRIRESKIKNN